MRASSRDPRFLNCLLPTTRCPVRTRGAAVDGGRVGLAKTRNMTNEPTSGQVAGNAQTISQIKVKSEIRSGSALDNVARFLERTEHGWSPDRGRFGTTKHTKHTKREQSIWRSSTRGATRSWGSLRGPKTRFTCELRPLPENRIRAQHRLIFFSTFRVFRVFRGSL